MEILAYETLGSWTRNLSVTYDATLGVDRLEADKYVSRIIPVPGAEGHAYLRTEKHEDVAPDEVE